MNKHKPKKTKYPETLTIDEFDDMPWKEEHQFGVDADTENLTESQKLKLVRDCAKQIRGIIYTQVDGEKDRVYSRGISIVNRTGIYEVVKL